MSMVLLHLDLYSEDYKLDPRMSEVRFSDCALASSDLLEANLDEVVFEECDLTGLDLRGATLRRCELRGCRLEDLRGVERLRGAAMPWPDILGAVGEWARALGIQVLQDP